MLPKSWTTGILVGTSSYISYEGNIYICSSGGVTGSTPPTHPTGTASDGGASWTYSGAPYETFRADTDEPVLDSEVVKRGIKWRFKQKSGLSVDAEKAEYVDEVKKAFLKKSGSRTINMSGSHSDKFDTKHYRII